MNTESVLAGAVAAPMSTLTLSRLRATALELAGRRTMVGWTPERVQSGNVLRAFDDQVFFGAPRIEGLTFGINAAGHASNPRVTCERGSTL